MIKCEERKECEEEENGGRRGGGTKENEKY